MVIEPCTICGKFHPGDECEDKGIFVPKIKHEIIFSGKDLQAENARLAAEVETLKDDLSRCARSRDDLGIIANHFKDELTQAQAEVELYKSGVRCPHCDELRLELGGLRAEVEKLRAEIKNHVCDLPDSIKEALNSGDGTYRP